MCLSNAFAAAETFSFQSVAQKHRFQLMLSELRCLVCQNQDLLGSHAPLAIDLKKRVYQLMQSGKSDEDIKSYLVERYGDFILFKPQVKPSTWLLWFAPGVFLLLGLMGMVAWIKRA
jgi:cytochrome c-type biogenesis protein CcmH